MLTGGGGGGGEGTTVEISSSADNLIEMYADGLYAYPTQSRRWHFLTNLEIYPMATQRIQLKRGLFANLPTSAMLPGEPLATTDRGTPT